MKILLAIVALAALALVVWIIARQASGIRRREYRRLLAERNLLAVAIADITAAADLFRDIDSVLAAQVRTTTRSLDQKRLDLTR